MLVQLVEDLRELRQVLFLAVVAGEVVGLCVDRDRDVRPRVRLLVREHCADFADRAGSVESIVCGAGTVIVPGFSGIAVMRTAGA